MTTDMNMNHAAAEVLRKPVPTGSENGFYLWLIVGCGLGGALLFTFIIALVCLRRRKLLRKKNSIYRPGQEFCPQNMMSSFSSTTSDDVSESGGSSVGRHFRRPLGPSASLDLPPSLLKITRGECVQPPLTRWHTVASSPHCRTVPGTLDIERDSDDENETDLPHRNPPCLYGRLWFSMLYKAGRLQVTLIKAKYLPGRGLSNSPRDPFVKIFLLPDEENFHQSRIRKRTLNPKFNETFDFNVSHEDVLQRTLKLSVYDVDKRKVRHCLGHVLQPLDPENTPLTGEVGWRDLEVASQAATVLGDIQISLTCNPYSNRIKATVCKVRNLHGIPEASVVYVKVLLYHGRKVIKTKRTVPQSTSTSLEELAFDETFSFAVSGRFFDSCSLSFGLVVKGCPESGSKDAGHGSVVLGPFMYARGEALQHWQEMLTNPRSMIVRWHPLEPPKGISHRH